MRKPKEVSLERYEENLRKKYRGLEKQDREIDSKLPELLVEIREEIQRAEYSRKTYTSRKDSEIRDLKQVRDALILTAMANSAAPHRDIAKLSGVPRTHMYTIRDRSIDNFNNPG